MNKVLKLVVAPAFMVFCTSFAGVNVMDSLVSSYEVPACQVVLKGKNRFADHIVNVRCFNNTAFTCTYEDLEWLRHLKLFLKTTPEYVQTFDFKSVKQVKDYVNQLKNLGYEVMFTFHARHRSRL